jgi:hypothetical protein
VPGASVANASRAIDMSTPVSSASANERRRGTIVAIV